MRPYLLAFFLLLLRIAAAQESSCFHHYTGNEGLAQNTVTALLQDKEGFIWIGTQDGLQRFDGYSFRTFRSRRDDPKTLCDKYILDLFDDGNGNIWVGTRDGICCFEKSTEQFRRMVMPADLGNSYRLVRGISADEKSVRVVIGNNLLERSNDSTFVHAAFSKNHLTDLLRIGGKDWMLSDSSFSSLDNSLILPGKFRAIYRSGEVALLISKDSVFRFDGLSKRAVSLAALPACGAINQALQDQQGRIWLATARGIWRWQSNGWKTLASDLPADKGPGSSAIESLLEDRSGLIWIGTSYNGLYTYDPLAEAFVNVSTSRLNNGVCWTFCAPASNELWVGTGNGLKVFQRRATELYWSAAGFPADTLTLPGLDALRGTAVSALLDGGDGTVWIGTNGQGLFVYDRTKKQFVHHYLRSSPDSLLPNDKVMSLLRARDGSTWIGTKDGVLMIAANGKGERVSIKKLSNRNASDYVLGMMEDHDGNIWFSTSTGVCCFNRQTKSAECWHADGRSGLNSNLIFSATEDRNNTIWLCTNDGLFRFDRATKHFSGFDISNGLKNNTVYGMLRDAQERLWLSSNEGLVRFEPERNHFSFFTSADGLALDEFSQNAFYRCSNGELFFGNAQGFTCFRPENVKENPVAPTVALTDISINYKPLSNSDNLVQGPRCKPERIELSYHEKTLSISFAGLNFRNTAENKYAYMLQGFDEQWVFPQPGQRTATYTSLPPGNYRFLVRASNNSGIWIDRPMAINVIVHPPFWQTWWFVAAIGLLLLSITVLIVRYYAQRRLKDRLRRLELQRRVQEERERISRDLHDNVGAQLTYIIHTLDNIAYKLPEQGATSGAERIGDLGGFARETMAQLRETIWALHRDNVSLEELRNKLQEHASRLLTISGRGECQIRTEGETLILQPTQAVNLFRIVQEAVNNSLKHASAERIEVVFLHEHKTLTVTVRDNGKGFDPTAEYDGHYGLGNMEARAREIGATFALNSHPGETLITLVLTLA